MKVIYIAGPYRAKHNYQIWDNIQTARELAEKVWQLGHVALCPHTNSMFMEGVTDAEGFIQGTLELMRRCDAILVCPGYNTSVGTKGEIREAQRLGTPIFFSIEELKSWLIQESQSKSSTCVSVPGAGKSG